RSDLRMRDFQYRYFRPVPRRWHVRQIQPQDLADVFASLVIGRHTAIALDGAFAGVVRRQKIGQVATRQSCSLTQADEIDEAGRAERAVDRIVRIVNTKFL